MKGYRTIAINAALAVLPILQLAEVIAVIPAEYLDWYVAGVAVLNIVLRAITTTPVGRKG